jgi:hypothetical protein
MASSINTDNIKTNYPIAGENNDTQGFRDNFSEIVDNLNAAESEITDLQTNTAKTNTESQFFGNRITNAELDQTTTTAYQFGNVDEDQTVNFQNGLYQTLTVRGDITLTLDGWPEAERLAKLTVSLVQTEGERTVNWRTLKDGNPGTIKRNQGDSFLLSDSTEVRLGNFPDPFVVDSETDPIVVEFWTLDGGETVHANYIGKFV